MRRRQPPAEPNEAEAGAPATRVLERQIDDAFQAFVSEGGFPCLAAKGVVHRRDYTLRVYDALASAGATAALASDLGRFARALPAVGDRLQAFVAAFTGPPPRSERAFERRLWAQLQRLHELDHPAAGWDPTVSDDPNDPRFSFSFAGRAFFVVGLHPGSARVARRFAWPALVFNPHAQFEQLRQAGRYDQLRTMIRERDVALQGTPNPNLDDFGTRSEARQYSGRDTTDPTWQCPFHRRDP